MTAYPGGRATTGEQVFDNAAVGTRDARMTINDQTSLGMKETWLDLREGIGWL